MPRSGTGSVTAGAAWLPVPFDSADFPPVHAPGDFSFEGLAAIRRAASALLESGFLLITESDYVGQVVERCGELEAQAGGGGGRLRGLPSSARWRGAGSRALRGPPVFGVSAR